MCQELCYILEITKMCKIYALLSRSLQPIQYVIISTLSLDQCPMFKIFQFILEPTYPLFAKFCVRHQRDSDEKS